MRSDGARLQAHEVRIVHPRRRLLQAVGMRQQPVRDHLQPRDLLQRLLAASGLVRLSGVSPDQRLSPRRRDLQARVLQH
jgi:hypothetical protein